MNKSDIRNMKGELTNKFFEENFKNYCANNDTPCPSKNKKSCMKCEMEWLKKIYIKLEFFQGKII